MPYKGFKAYKNLPDYFWLTSSLGPFHIAATAVYQMHYCSVITSHTFNLIVVELVVAVHLPISSWAKSFNFLPKTSSCVDKADKQRTRMLNFRPYFQVYV